MKRPVDPISDRNPRVVSAVKLTDTAHRKRAGLFLVEGANAVGAAVETGAAVELFVTEVGAARYASLLASTELPAHVVSEKVARQLADTVSSPGVFAVCTQVAVPLDEVLGRLAGVGRPVVVAVLVDVNDPGNAGTVIRVADAAGADAVILAGDSVDPHNGKCVRASAGSFFHLPLVRERDTGAVLHALRSAGLALLATTAAGSVELTDPQFGAERLACSSAWVFGNEAHGLPEWVCDRADERVRIPIYGRAESLNLATAATLCLYESATCQRRRIPSAEECPPS